MIIHNRRKNYLEISEHWQELKLTAQLYQIYQIIIDWNILFFSIFIFLYFYI